MDIQKLVKKVESELLSNAKKKSCKIAKSIYGKLDKKENLNIDVQVKWKGLLHRKHFCFGRDYEDIILKALEWRNSKEKEIDKPRSEEIFFIDYKRLSPTDIQGIILSTTGVLGIKDHCSYFLVECIDKNNNVIKSKFSINELCRDKAFEMAKEFYNKNHHTPNVEFDVSKIPNQESAVREACKIFKKYENKNIGLNRTKNYKLAKSIYWIHYPKNTLKKGGIFVRVIWKVEKRERFFIFLSEDDKVNVFLKALAWRNKTEMELEKPRAERSIRIGCKKTNTGYPGVSCSYMTYRGIRYPYFRAHCINKEGKRVGANISIEKHGEEKAFHLAKKFYLKYHYLKGSSFPTKKMSK